MTLAGISASYTESRSLLSRLSGMGSRASQSLTALTGEAAAASQSGDRAKAEASAAHDNADAARKARAAQRLEDIKAQLAILKRSSLSPQSMARLAGELASQLAGVAQDLGGTGLDLPTAASAPAGGDAAATAATIADQADLPALDALPEAYREALATGDALTDADKSDRNLLQQAQALMQELQALMRRGADAGPTRDKKLLAEPAPTTGGTILIL